MGCKQSKASNDQVVERVSVDVPAVEAPASESIKATEPEAAVEVPAEELPTAPASVPVEAAEEEPLKTPEPDAPVEEAVEEPAASVEEVVEKPAAAVEAEVAEEPVAAVEEPAEEAAAPVEEEAAAHVEEEAAQVEEIPKTEEKAAEAEPEETPVEAEAPKSEAVAEEEAPKTEPAVVDEAAVEAPVEMEAPAEDFKAEVVAAPATEDKPVEGSLTFKADDVTFNDKGAAFYNFDGTDASNPANDVHLTKRYSEFKALHAQLAHLLADNQDSKAADLPALPKASFLQGRKNKKMLLDRKTQFTELLNAISSHPVASQCDVFKAFLA